MKTIQVSVQPIDEKAIAKKPVSEVPAGFRLVNEPVKVVDQNGKTLIVLAQLRDLDQLRERLRGFKGFVSSARGSGLLNTSKIFGYQPRAAVRMRPYCSSAAIHREDITLGAMLAAQAPKLSQIFQEQAPAEFAVMRGVIEERVRPEWRMGGSVYTSGIVNKSNALAYHKDRGNFPACWSAMITFRRGITGGLLVIPEISLAFDLPDQSALFFDGQGLWHGVTPIVKADPKAERFTAVYYALAEMWKCLTIKEEIAAARKSRTETETKRAKLHAAKTS